MQEKNFKVKLALIAFFIIGGLSLLVMTSAASNLFSVGSEDSSVAGPVSTECSDATSDKDFIVFGADCAGVVATPELTSEPTPIPTDEQTPEPTPDNQSQLEWLLDGIDSVSKQAPSIVMTGDSFTDDSAWEGFYTGHLRRTISAQCSSATLANYSNIGLSGHTIRQIVDGQLSNSVASQKPDIVSFMGLTNDVIWGIPNNEKSFQNVDQAYQYLKSGISSFNSSSPDTAFIISEIPLMNDGDKLGRSIEETNADVRKFNQLLKNDLEPHLRQQEILGVVVSAYDFGWVQSDMRSNADDSFHPTVPEGGIKLAKAIDSAMIPIIKAYGGCGG